MGHETKFPDSKAQALNCRIIWPSVKMCVLTGAKCWAVQEVEVNDSSTELIQSTPNPKHTKRTGWIHICFPMSYLHLFSLSASLPFPATHLWLLFVSTPIKFGTLWLNPGFTL